MLVLSAVSAGVTVHSIIAFCSCLPKNIKLVNLTANNKSMLVGSKQTEPARNHYFNPFFRFSICFLGVCGGFANTGCICLMLDDSFSS